MGQALQGHRGSESLAGGMVSAKAQGQKGAGCVQGTEKWSIWLELNEPGEP